MFETYLIRPKIMEKLNGTEEKKSELQNFNITALFICIHNSDYNSSAS